MAELKKINVTDATDITDSFQESLYGKSAVKPYDSFVKTTKDMSEIKSLTNAITEETKVMAVKFRDIDLFSVNQFDGKELSGWLHTGNMAIPKKISAETLIKAGADAKLMEELLVSENNGDYKQLMLAVIRKNPADLTAIEPGDIYFVGVSTYLTLMQRSQVLRVDSGRCGETDVRVFRNSTLKAEMYHSDEMVQVLFREFRTDAGTVMRKIFAVFTMRYGIIPQADLIGIVDPISKEMGASNVESFTMTHDVTELIVEFPKKAAEFKSVYSLKDNVVPLLVIRTSDVGNTSAIIRGGFRLGDEKWVSYMPGAYVTRSHTNKADTERILADASNKIFSEYTKIPERMMELMMMPSVADPVQKTKDLLKSSGLKTQLGEKRYAEIEEELTSAYGPIPYGPYDIIKNFLSILNEFEESRNYALVDKIREKVMRVVFEAKF